MLKGQPSDFCCSFRWKLDLELEQLEAVIGSPSSSLSSGPASSQSVSRFERRHAVIIVVCLIVLFDHMIITQSNFSHCDLFLTLLENA